MGQLVIDKYVSVDIRKICPMNDIRLFTAHIKLVLE
jgi:hypothetical protein